MATVARTEILFKLKAALKPSSPYDGAYVPIETLIDQVLGNGTTVNLADKVGRKTGTIGASTNADIDLRAITDATGTALNCAEVCIFILEWSSANAADLTVKKAAANGWAGIASGTTDGVVLKPGEKYIRILFADPAIAMSGTNKDINLANAGAEGAYTITIVGRSA